MELLLLGIGVAIYAIWWIATVVDKSASRGDKSHTPPVTYPQQLNARAAALDRREQEIERQYRGALNIERLNKEYSYFKRIKSDLALETKSRKLNSFKEQLDQRVEELDRRETEICKLREAVLLLAKQKATGFPWLADAYADLFHLEEIGIERQLLVKANPSRKGAEEVRKAGLRRRDAEKRARILEYQAKYLEALFPWLEDFKSDEIADELIRIGSTPAGDSENEDPARRWLTPEEYQQLSTSEKYERALERYWTGQKTRWEIGRDYERYIGYRYESRGSTVRYQGIVKGFDDLGRDLIVRRNDMTEIVQCKNWAHEKRIHEKHIFQLYGTFIAYRFDHPDETVYARFVTSTTLSERAMQFADMLTIKVSERLPLVRYPCVKCHVSKSTGEKIYHLPFDQQYDRTIIEMDKGEHYVETVKEAEALGFRRAYRHHRTSDK